MLFPLNHYPPPPSENSDGQLPVCVGGRGWGILSMEELRVQYGAAQGGDLY